MKDAIIAFITDSTFFYVFLTLITYELGIFLKNKFKMAIFNPMMISILLSIVVIVVLKIDISKYKQGTKFISFLLTPATVCLAIPLYAQFGGIPAITVAVIVITGIVGNLFAEVTLKLFKITDPVAKGVAIGTSSHALGTTKAMEIGEVEGAMSSLSIAVAGIITVILFSFFAQAL